MADNYLENAHEIYERRKAMWLKKKKKLTNIARNIEKPEDEAL